MLDFISKWFGASGAQAALEQLRRAPEQAMRACSFVVVDEAYPDRATGGPCRLTCATLDEDVVRITVEPGMGDYYFPWVPRGGGGVGECIVPLGCPDGTIVLTGGMNGCAFQVNRTRDGLRFYHDADSCSLQQDTLEGDQLCRVGYRDYATPFDLGRAAFLDTAPPTDGGAFHYAYYLVAVKHVGRWGVYASGVVTSGSRHKRINVPFPCLTSFDE